MLRARARLRRHRRRLRSRRAADAHAVAALLAVAGFLGEDSVIRAYGFYFYSPRWHLFLDRVPLMIVVIWPVVIHSAWSLARRLAPRALGAARRRRHRARRCIVDRAHRRPCRPVDLDRAGPLRRPAHRHRRLGLLRRRRHGCASSAPTGPVAAVVVAPLATHVLLIASWWLALQVAVGPAAAVALRRRRLGRPRARSPSPRCGVPGRRPRISQGSVTSWTRSRLLLRLTRLVWPRSARAYAPIPSPSRRPTSRFCSGNSARSTINRAPSRVWLDRMSLRSCRDRRAALPPGLAAARGARERDRWSCPKRSRSTTRSRSSASAASIC